MRARAGAWLLLSVALLGGCAVPRPGPTTLDQKSWAAGGADHSGRLPPPQAPSAGELMALSEDMRRFAQAATQGHTGIHERAQALAQALSDPAGRGLVYDAGATLTAREAFEQRRVNCLSYTLLYVALAREAGIDAQFNLVDVPPIWDLLDKHGLVLYLHVNARIDLSANRFDIIDINRQEYALHFPQRRLTEREIEALYHNNRAVEWLPLDADRALAHAVAAIERLPQRADLWSNLARIYLERREFQAARIAADTALELDPRSRTAYGNAASVYAALGQPGTARWLRQRAEYFQRQNPYYHYARALSAYQRHDDSEAYGSVRRALALDPHEPRFFFLLGAVLLRMDEPERARDSIALAISLSGDPKLQARYRSKLERIGHAA